MNVKAFLQDFPTANGRVVATILLIMLTGVVVCARLALGENFPNGYDTWIWALVVLAGVDSAHVVGKRLSDFRYKAAAGASPATETTVETAGPAEVKVKSDATAATPPVITKENQMDEIP